MKRFMHLLAVLLCTVLFSCTETDQNPTSVILKSDTSSIPNDGSTAATFSIQADGKDVTMKSMIYMSTDEGLQILEQNNFTSQIPGEYEFYAIYAGVESNRIKISVSNEFASPVRLTASTFNIPDDGQTATVFTVYDEDTDVTSASVIYEINESGRKALPGNTFSSSIEGMYQFVASYSGLESDPIYIVVESADSFELPLDSNIENTDFFHSVMLLKNTGTSCAFCPLVSAAIKEVLKEEQYSNKMGVVEVHNFNEDDPMMIPLGLRIREVFGVAGWPLVIYDMRKELTSASEGGDELSPQENMAINIATVKEIVDKQAEEQADAGICAVSRIEGSTLRIKAAVKAAKTAEYHLGVFLVEDNIKASQNEYGPDTEAYPEDFDANKHMNVLRAAHDGIDTETDDISGISLGNIEAGDSASTEMTITINRKWVIDNCHLVLYVCSAEGDRYVTRNVINSRIGQKTAYKYN